jgi:ribulose-5-phosphate 4-epimerase/fuculose-1-phosphate aldolase
MTTMVLMLKTKRVAFHLLIHVFQNAKNVFHVFSRLNMAFDNYNKVIIKGTIRLHKLVVGT